MLKYLAIFLPLLVATGYLGLVVPKSTVITDQHITLDLEITNLEKSYNDLLHHKS